MDLLLGSLAVFLGGLLQGCAGFGLAFLIAPVLMLLHPVTSVPPLLVGLSLANNLVVLVDARKRPDLRALTPLLAGGVLGIPVGAELLTRLDPALIKLAVGVVILAVALALLLGWRTAVRRDWPRLTPVGLLSGILGGATGLSGPPVILLFAAEQADKQSFRVNLVGFFLLLNLVSLATYGVMGLMGGVVPRLSLTYLPAMLLGSYLGTWLARRLNEQVFRRAVLVLILILGLVLVGSNLAHPR